MKELELTYVGRDGHQRRVFQDKNKRYFKTYEEGEVKPSQMYTAANFEGEPEYELDENKVRIKIIGEE